MTAQIERALQAEIMVRLRAWPVIALPIPNGIWIPARTAPERAMVARIISQMKANGLLVAGAPDLVLLWFQGAALVELKRPASRDLLTRRQRGRPTEAQAAIAERAAELGVRHAYVTSWDELRDQMVVWGVCAPVNHFRLASAMVGAA